MYLAADLKDLMNDLLHKLIKVLCKHNFASIFLLTSYKVSRDEPPSVSPLQQRDFHLLSDYRFTFFLHPNKFWIDARAALSHYLHVNDKLFRDTVHDKEKAWITRTCIVAPSRQLLKINMCYWASALRQQRPPDAARYHEHSLQIRSLRLKKIQHDLWQQCFFIGKMLQG